MSQVRRLVSLLLCLLVGACLTLPAQVAYRCTAMADRRLAEPCCPSELLLQLPPALDRQFAAPTAARVEPRGVPPSTPLPRAGVTVLQI